MEELKNMGCDSVKSNASEIDAENMQLCYETHKKAFGEWLEQELVFQEVHDFWHQEVNRDFWFQEIKIIDNITL